MASNLFKTFLKPSESVMVALATGALVWGSYTHNLPDTATIHQTEPYNTNIDAGRKKAMWTSAAIVGGAFLLTHDANVFMVGAGSFLLLEWMARHANATHPNTGKVMARSASDALSSGYAQQDMNVTEAPTYVPEYWG